MKDLAPKKTNKKNHLGRFLNASGWSTETVEAQPGLDSGSTLTGTDALKK